MPTALGTVTGVVNTYTVGQVVLATVKWTDNTPDSPTFGQIVLPATSAVARGPSETEQSPAVIGPDPAGLFIARVTPDVPGDWWYGFTAIGSFTGYAEWHFLVNARRA